MSRNVWIVIAVIVLGLAGWFFLQFTNTQTEMSSVDNSATTSASPETAKKNVVVISSAGFFPKEITVKSGEAVSWKNEDSVVHTVNSDPHPTHTIYQPMNQVGKIQAGEEKSFTFDVPGTYKYHDHLNPSLTGIVTVQ